MFDGFYRCLCVGVAGGGGGERNSYTSITVELQWLDHHWDHEN